MRVGQRTVIVAGTFFLAAATGHVMQNGLLSPHVAPEGLQSASLTSADASVTTAATPTDAEVAALKGALPDLPDLPTLAPVALDGGARLASRMEATRSDAAWPDSALSRLEFDNSGRPCGAPTLTLAQDKAAAALLSLKVVAPCHASQRITVGHAGLAFAARLDDKGMFATSVPVLSAKGAVSVRFETGATLNADQPVGDLASVSRTAVVLRGQAGLFLTASLPAKAGKQVRIDAERPGTVGDAGGYLTLLGDPTLDRPVLSQILTLPAALESSATAALSASVNEMSCGRDLLATTLTLPAGNADAQGGAVSFAMPACGDNSGGRLVMDLAQAARMVAAASMPSASVPSAAETPLQR